MRTLYTVLFYAVTPLIIARLYWRGRNNPAYRRRILERFGYYRDQPRLAGPIWLHAVSVGEVESAVPLVRHLREHRPDCHILFTTTTPTGSDRVRALLDNQVQHCYLPYDLPQCVDRFFRHFRPLVAIVLETEIWPNLFAACSDSSIPLLIVNGRLSARSVRGYRRLGSLVRSTLSHVTAIAAQSAEDADRFIAIGAAREKVSHLGNMKFDLELPDSLLEQGRSDRRRLFGDRPTLLAASTHEGEEHQLLAAYRQLVARHPGLLLILVPRHPERFRSVETLCRTAGFSTVLRSEQRVCTPDDQIFLLDRMGELKRFYAAADLAFVGGSLVPVGGHNVLEPAAAGIPVLFGPHVDNFRDVCSQLVAAGGAQPCDDVDALILRADELLSDGSQRTDIGTRGRTFVSANRGTVHRIGTMIENHLAMTAG